MRGQFVICAVMFAGMTLAGCRGGAPISTSPTVDPDMPQIFFTNIEDGALVSSPVVLEWDAVNFIIEPWGDMNNGPVVREGAGHVHILIDRPCIEPGEQIPNPSDGSIRHYLSGGTRAELNLPPGEHRLCMQAGNGAHMALPGEGLQVQITLTVEE